MAPTNEFAEALAAIDRWIATQERDGWPSPDVETCVRRVRNGLVAEVARLRAELGGMVLANRAALREVDRLHSTLEPEIARLKAQLVSMEADIERLRTENARLQEAKRTALRIADAKSYENVGLRAALQQALRQWKMYSEMAEGNDGFELTTEMSPEADLYRQIYALAHEQSASREGD